MAEIKDRLFVRKLMAIGPPISQRILCKRTMPFSGKKHRRSNGHGLPLLSLIPLAPSPGHSERHGPNSIALLLAKIRQAVVGQLTAGLYGYDCLTTLK